MLEQLLFGFHQALTLHNLMFIAFGVSLGIIFGALPGMGSVTAMAILIPVTFFMSPLAALSFLLGLNKGGTFGGAIPAILLNAPGTPEATATTFDGYPLAKKGKPEKALKMSLYSSVFGDFVSDTVLIIVAAPFALVALKFGPPELTAIILFAFTLIGGLSGDSLVKGIAAAFAGVLLAMIGLDPVVGTPRLTFNLIELGDGLPLIPMGIGLLALSSVLEQLFDMSRSEAQSQKGLVGFDRSAQRISFREFLACIPTLLRSAFIGTGVGALPGLGVSLAAFLGYGAAKRASKTPEEFGTGVLKGIAASEAANSAVVGANLIPTIALGIPGNVAAALMIGAFMIHGVTPGPLMLEQHGELIYAMFAAMLIANFVHLFIGRIGLKLFSLITYIPNGIILSVVVAMCMSGAFMVSQSFVDVAIMCVFAAVGLIMRKLGFSIVSLVVGFLLGPIFELSLRQTLLLHENDLSVMLSHPISLGFLALTVYSIWRFSRRPAAS